MRGNQKIVGSLDAESSAAIGGGFTALSWTLLMGALNAVGKVELVNRPGRYYHFSTF